MKSILDNSSSIDFFNASGIYSVETNLQYVPYMGPEI